MPESRRTRTGAALSRAAMTCARRPDGVTSNCGDATYPSRWMLLLDMAWPTGSRRDVSSRSSARAGHPGVPVFDNRRDAGMQEPSPVTVLPTIPQCDVASPPRVQAIPAFLTIAVMPLTYSIAYGVVAGLGTYIIINGVNWAMDSLYAGVKNLPQWVEHMRAVSLEVLVTILQNLWPWPPSASECISPACTASRRKSCCGAQRPLGLPAAFQMHMRGESRGEQQAPG